MKIFKYFFFLLLIAFIAGSIYIATKEGDYHFEESRMIEAPATLLYNEVHDFKTWQNWSAWTNAEDMKITATERTKGEGSGISWKSDDLNDGSLVTESSIPNRSIEQKMLLNTSVTDIKSNVYWNFEPSENGTMVTWGMKGDLNFKEKLALSLQNRDLQEIFGSKFRQGLEKLEENTRHKMEEYSINVDGTTQHGGGYYMYTTTSSKMDEVHDKAAEMVQQVSRYMKSNNISISGKPFILYNQRNEQTGTSIFSAAVPTSSQVITPSGSPVLNGFLPAQKAVKTTLKGNYKNTPEAWKKAYRYIEENELTINTKGEPVEIFINLPAEEQNPALWITEIFIPVE